MAVVSMLDDIHPLTVEEYLLLAEASSWERTELIGGVVYDMAAQFDLHARTVMNICLQLAALFPGLARTGGSLRLGRHTMIQPDAYVLLDTTIDPDAAVSERQVRLVVEVSVSTQARDLGPKLRACAAAGIPEYWVIDPRTDHEYLLRHTEPVGDTYGHVRRIPVGYAAEELDAGGVLAS